MDILFDNFELIANSPDGIKKLREIILQLAVQGKLVKQDPNDEPASILLEKIQAEKQKLIDQGKIIKPKPILPKSDNEKNFALPKNWYWVNLGDIHVFNYGKAIQKDNIDGPIPAYGANGVLKYVKSPYIEDKCIIVGRKGSAGAVNMIESPCWPSDVTYYILELENFNFKYTYYLLKSLKLESFGYGIKPGLNRNDAYKIEIGLPPLAEQKRIVERVDSLMALCDELEKQKESRDHKQLSLGKASISALLTAKDKREFDGRWQFIVDNFEKIFDTAENIKELKAAILQLAVQGKLVPQDPTDEPASKLLEKIQAEKQKLIDQGKFKKQKPLPPITDEDISYQLPQNWVWSRLQDSFDVRDGTHDTPKYQNVGVPLITSKNFSNGKIDFSSAKYISEEDHIEISKRSYVEKNDILFSMIGGNIGNMVMVNTEIEFSIKNVALFKYYNAEITYPKFLFVYLKYFSNEVQQMALGGAQPFVSLTFLRKHVIGLPPLAEQKRIVKRVDSLMELCDKLQEQLEARQTKTGKFVKAIMSQV